MPLGLFKGERTCTLELDGSRVTKFAMREEFSGPLPPLIWRSMPDLGPSFDRFAAGLKARAEAASYARRPTPAPSRDEIRLVSTLRWKVVCESGTEFAVAEAIQETVKIVRRQRRQPSVENLVVVHLRRWLGGREAVVSFIVQSSASG